MQFHANYSQMQFINKQNDKSELHDNSFDQQINITDYDISLLDLNSFL